VTKRRPIWSSDDLRIPDSSHDGYRSSIVRILCCLLVFGWVGPLTAQEEDPRLDKDFGGGTLGYQINLPVSKIVSDRWTVHFNAGATLFPDVQDHDLVNFNLGASAIFAVSRRFNLMLECVGYFDEEVDDIGRLGDSNSVILSPGVRYAFNFKNDAQMVVGLAAPVGLTSAAPDFGLFLYFSFEHFFAR